MLRLWSTIRRNGWFKPGTIGTLLPFPARWQGWACLLAFLLPLLATAALPHRAAAPTRIGLAATYIALGIATFE